MKIKFRGIIEKIVDNYTVLIKDLFKKESNINVHLNKTIIMSLTGNEGKLTASFGKSGKVKVIFFSMNTTISQFQYYLGGFNA